MKKKLTIFAFLLISLLGLNSQVKADTTPDTIRYWLPHAQVFLCVDSLNFPTFVVYKPNGFVDVMWRINNQYYGSGDSLVFTPTNIGTYRIDAIWGINVQTMYINLYSEAPPSPDFVVTNGGSINATGDTAWMCAPSITIDADNIFDSDATSQYWEGPNGFYSTGNPITVSTLGTYSFTRPNPCGSTVDSIVVVQLPTQLPVLTDILKCNEDLNDTIDAGPGWTSYQWTMGTITDSTQAVVITPSLLGDDGTLAVHLAVSNQCITLLQDTILVEQQLYPEPDLLQHSINANNEICHDEIATLSPDSMYTYDTYTWTSNVDPNFISHAPTINVDYQMGSGQYYLEVTKGSCVETDQIAVVFFPTPPSVDLCVATFDPIVGKNKVVFMHDEDMTVDYILRHKPGDEWVTLDSISVTGTGLYDLFEIYDQINDPGIQSQTYSVLARHECGHTSELNNWHKTLRIGIYKDAMTEEYVLQVLENYRTLSGYEPSSYKIYVDSTGSGENLVEVGIMYGSNSSFTLINPVQGGYYYTSIELPWECYPDSKNANNIVFSNKKQYNTVDIPWINLPDVNIFPNPSSGIFYIDGIDDYSTMVEVHDVLGRLLVSEKNTNKINLKQFGPGVYNATFKLLVTNGPVTISTIKLMVY
jgi:hypothetical protein